MRLFLKRPIYHISFVILLVFLLPLQNPTAQDSSTVHNYFRITITPSQIKQGQSFTVFLDSASSLKSLHLSGLGQKLPIYRIWHQKHQHLYRAILGVPVKQELGVYNIVAEAIDDQDQPIRIYGTLDVIDGNYTIQRIHLTKKKASLLDSKELNREGQILGKKLRLRSHRVFFASHFAMPAKGRISSPFGAKRQYNDKKFSSYHKGIDIANKRGTPVKASNGGKVSLAKDMKSNGRIILINHGHGITTIYAHLSAIKVKEGQWVKQGETIGEIGSTGISSGPHLHFGFSVNNVRVDPWQWLNENIVLYYNGPN